MDNGNIVSDYPTPETHPDLFWRDGTECWIPRTWAEVRKLAAELDEIQDGLGHVILDEANAHADEMEGE